MCLSLGVLALTRAMYVRAARGLKREPTLRIALPLVLAVSAGRRRRASKNAQAASCPCSSSLLHTSMLLARSSLYSVPGLYVTVCDHGVCVQRWRGRDSWQLRRALRERC